MIDVYTKEVFRALSTIYHGNSTAQKMKFSIKDFFSKRDQIRRKQDLVAFTEKILNVKLHFFTQCIFAKYSITDV